MVYKIIVFVILVTIVLGLSWRNSANGQQHQNESETRASQMLYEMVQNLEQRDIRVSYRAVGRVRDVRETAKMLLNGPQYYLEITRNRFELVALNMMEDLLGALLLHQIESVIAVDDIVYVLDVNGQNIRVVMSEDGSRSGGLFLMFSRVHSDASDDDVSVEREECERKVLSTDLFSRPAEYVKACCRATCLNGSIQNCELKTVVGGHWYFGYIDLDPDSEDTPKPGHVEGNWCRAYVNYSWGVRFGLPHLGFSIQGPGEKGEVTFGIRCES